MAKKSIEELFSDFCGEHNIYAVAAFSKNVTIDNVCDTRPSNAMAGNTQQASVAVLDALADGCEQQAIRLDEFEKDREAEINVHISERSWFAQ